MNLFILGTCVNTSYTEFVCICADGWTNRYCETKVNYCHNISCQNGGICRPLFRDYRCECVSSSYSGRHCEITTSALIARKTLSRSFGYIAIICISIVIGFIVILDILKYFFRIDPVRGARERLRRRYIQKKKKKPGVAVRFVYVNAPPTDPNSSTDTSVAIIEETTV